MKSKISKILFGVSFIPYLWLVIGSIVNAVNGVSTGFFGDQTPNYGAEGYAISFVFTFFVLWPVFIACLLCQIIILLIEKLKKKSKVKFYVIGMIIIYIIGTIPLLF